MFVVRIVIALDSSKITGQRIWVSYRTVERVQYSTYISCNITYRAWLEHTKGRFTGEFKGGGRHPLASNFAKYALYCMLQQNFKVKLVRHDNCVILNLVCTTRKASLPTFKLLVPVLLLIRISNFWQKSAQSEVMWKHRSATWVQTELKIYLC